MLHAGLAHLARANDHHRLLAQIGVKNFFGQFHGHAAHRGRAAADARFRAHQLGHLQRRLERPVQALARELRRLGGLIGVFDLARNFGFADHQRVQPAGHREKVLRRIQPFVHVEVGGEIQARVFGQFLKEPGNGGAAAFRHAVDFHPVAGGKQHHLGKPAAQFQAAAAALEP